MELKISNLTKSYGEIAAVNHVSYTLNEGVYGLLGVNGAGKTTLMRMLCTLQKPTDGSITWNEKDIFQMGGEYRKLIGYLPQDFGYYPDFTVYDYLMYIAAIKGLRPVAAKKRAKLLLKQVGLEKAENMKMKKLSGGMKRRAGIAQAMLNNPSILFLDGGGIRMEGTAEKLISSMEEQVWSVSVPREDVGSYMKAYKVANMKNVQKGVELRILSARKPADHAVLETAVLEDVFLYYFGERAGEEDGQI